MFLIQRFNAKPSKYNIQSNVKEYILKFHISVGVRVPEDE